jgi:hypothetical protein
MGHPCRFAIPVVPKEGILGEVARGGDVEKNIRAFDQWIDEIVRKLGVSEEPRICARAMSVPDRPDDFAS